MPHAERHRRLLTAVLLPCTVAAGAGSAAWRAHTSGSEPAGVFPLITSEALDKSTIALPGQLQGAYNLLLLSWARDQGPDVNSWSAVGQALLHSYPDLRVYRMPVSSPENFLFRWWDNASMRTDETDPESLHWTIPLYTDEAKLRDSIGVPAGDHDVLALLVNRSGRVLWKAQGASTAASRQSLLEAAQQLHAKLSQ